MRRVIIAVAAGAAVAVAITGGALAYASIPDSSGVIHGCYTVKGGSLRVIDTAKGQTCATGQHALNWNQKGPQGPPGPAGVSGYSVALCTVTTTDSNGDLTVSSSSGGTCSGLANEAILTCPSGKVALSWSERPTPPQPPLEIGGMNAQGAYLSSDHTGYRIRLDSTGTVGSGGDLEVTCANVS